MDFVEGVPKVNGKSVILTVVDRFSKYAHFMPLAHPYTAASVARVFFDEVVRLRGMPASIVSDRDPVFTSSLWRELFSLSGVQLHYSTAFHPQSDGQSEATNKIIMMYLRCLTVTDRVSGSVGFPGRSIVITPLSRPPSGRHRSGLCTAVILLPFLPMVLVTPSFRRWNNRCWSVMNFCWRFVTVWNRRSSRQSSSTTSRTGSWSSRWAIGCFYAFCIGPQRHWLTIEVAGSWVLATMVLIRCLRRLALLLMASSCLLVRACMMCFHVGLLKPFVGEPPERLHQLPPVRHGRACVEPDKVLRGRLARGTYELLVQWKNSDSSAASWVPLSEFRQLYPTFQEDELLLQGEEMSCMAMSTCGARRRRRRQSPDRTGFNKPTIVADF